MTISWQNNKKKKMVKLSGFFLKWVIYFVYLCCILHWMDIIILISFTRTSNRSFSLNISVQNRNYIFAHSLLIFLLLFYFQFFFMFKRTYRWSWCKSCSHMRIKMGFKKIQDCKIENFQWTFNSSKILARKFWLYHSSFY